MIWLTLLVSLAWGADNTYDKIRLDRIDISVRQLQKGRPTITGTPTFQNGMSWGAGTTETTGLTGAIFLYASSTTPTGWLDCDTRRADTKTAADIPAFMQQSAATGAARTGRISTSPISGGPSLGGGIIPLRRTLCMAIRMRLQEAR